MDDVLRHVLVFESVTASEEGALTERSGSVVPARRGGGSSDGVTTAPAWSGAEVDPLVAELLAGPEALGPEMLQLTVVGQMPDGEEPPHYGVAILRAILVNDLVDAADEERVRRALVGEREARAAEVVAQLEARVASLGGRVLARSPTTAILDVALAAEHLPALVATEGVALVEQKSGGSPDESYGWSTTGWASSSVDGDEAEELLQTRPFYRHTAGPWRGAGEEIGLFEIDSTPGVAAEHPGLLDGAGGHRAPTCTLVSSSPVVCAWDWPDPGAIHPTAVAGILGGDVTNGQDPGVPADDTEERRRSGVARDAVIVGLHDTSAAETEAFFLSPQFEGRLVNMSATVDGSTDLACTGRSAWARAVDAVYEAGIAWFKSAGNTGYLADPEVCTVGNPGAAIGAFTVGGYQLSGTTYQPFLKTSRGGTSAMGRGRTIIGLSAPAITEYPYHHAIAAPVCSSLYQYLDDGVCYAAFNGTSAATPFVAGAAAVFREWFVDTRSHLIDDPGILYANLLLMGDRWAQTGGLTDHFDNLTGAGRLRMRVFDNVGMDNPWGYGTGAVCVGHQEEVDVPIGSGTFPAVADRFRFVAWWYDRRFDDSFSWHDHDRVYVSADVGALHESAETPDNRQRVQFESGVGGSAVTVTLRGHDVSADGEGCGVDATRVFFAWFYEQSTRGDLDLDADGALVMPQIREVE